MKAIDSSGAYLMAADAMERNRAIANALQFDLIARDDLSAEVRKEARQRMARHNAQADEIEIELKKFRGDKS